MRKRRLSDRPKASASNFRLFLLESINILVADLDTSYAMSHEESAGRYPSKTLEQHNVLANHLAERKKPKAPLFLQDLRQCPTS